MQYEKTGTMKPVCLAVLAGLCAVAPAAAAKEVVETVQSPCKVSPMEGGGVFADFGKDAFGWLEIDIPKGKYVVRAGEKLDENGRIDMSPGFATYTCEPHCGKLKVSGTVPTVRGPVRAGAD